MKNTLKNIVLAGTVLGGALMVGGGCVDLGDNFLGDAPERLPSSESPSNAVYSEPLEWNPYLRRVTVYDDETRTTHKIYEQIIPGKEEENKLYEERMKIENEKKLERIFGKQEVEEEKTYEGKTSTEKEKSRDTLGSLYLEVIADEAKSEEKSDANIGVLIFMKALEKL